MRLASLGEASVSATTSFSPWLYGAGIGTARAARPLERKACFSAARLLQVSPAAEDIAQETFIKLWEKHASFHSPQAIKSFLYITARNACFNHMKKAQTGAKNHTMWSGVWDEKEDNVLNQLTRTEVVREIYIMLNMLPPECRKVMRYYFIEGKENHEIASLLNISISTVKNQKTRAISLIRKKLGNRPLILITLALLQMRAPFN